MESKKVAMGLQCLLWKYFDAKESHWLLWSHWLIWTVTCCHGDRWLQWRVNGCLWKSMISLGVTGCYWKSLVAMEVDGCFCRGTPDNISSLALAVFKNIFQIFIIHKTSVKCCAAAVKSCPVIHFSVVIIFFFVLQVHWFQQVLKRGHQKQQYIMKIAFKLFISLLLWTSLKKNKKKKPTKNGKGVYSRKQGASFSRFKNREVSCY
jgi:hypothetical protein